MVIIHHLLTMDQVVAVLVVPVQVALLVVHMDILVVMEFKF